MKQSPTMSKVLIVFLLAIRNLCLLVSVVCVTILPLSTGLLTFSELLLANLGSIRSVLIILVNTQTILP